MNPLGRLAAWYFFYFAFVGAFAPYFTLYLQDIGQSAWEIGVLMSVPQVMRLLAPNLWGWLADHLGRRAAVVKFAALGSGAEPGLFNLGRFHQTVGNQFVQYFLQSQPVFRQARTG